MKGRLIVCVLLVGILAGASGWCASASAGGGFLRAQRAAAAARREARALDRLAAAERQRARLVARLYAQQRAAELRAERAALRAERLALEAATADDFYCDPAAVRAFRQRQELRDYLDRQQLRRQRLGLYGY